MDYVDYVVRTGQEFSDTASQLTNDEYHCNRSQETGGVS